MAAERVVLRVVMHDASAFQGEEETIRYLLAGWPDVSRSPRAVQALAHGGTTIMLRAVNPAYVSLVQELRHADS